jgi:LGFP repeat
MPGAVSKNPRHPAVHPIHPDPSSNPIGRSSFSGQATVAANQLVRFYLSPAVLTTSSGVSGLVRIVTAQKGIADKASQLGFAGNPLGDVEGVPGGYVRRYQFCDIYYSPSTGAHEVHGEIKTKYDAILGPASVLALPTTDETAVGDGMGRFNNFQHGSSTGPLTRGQCA